MIVVFLGIGRLVVRNQSASEPGQWEIMVTNDCLSGNNGFQWFVIEKQQANFIDIRSDCFFK